MTKTKTNSTDPQTVFIYRGDGLGIPGLPHEVTRKQAKTRGLIKQLEAALKSGVYTAKERGTSQVQETVSMSRANPGTTLETPANPEQET
jgi:hypothetical protein